LPDVRQTIVPQGGGVVAGTPEVFDKVVRADVARIDDLVKNAGLRAD
jgi:tripartite-type tricarboxylate transporter receptor subunit TctC